MRKHKWIRTTIAEPYPVLSRGEPREQSQGPYYAANSEWFALYSARAMRHAEFSAEHTRARGYTVNVDLIER